MIQRLTSLDTSQTRNEEMISVAFRLPSQANLSLLSTLVKIFPYPIQPLQTAINTYEHYMFPLVARPPFQLLYTVSVPDPQDRVRLYLRIPTHMQQKERTPTPRGELAFDSISTTMLTQQQSRTSDKSTSSAPHPSCSEP
jgi:hypothetical protein